MLGLLRCGALIESQHHGSMNFGIAVYDTLSPKQQPAAAVASLQAWHPAVEEPAKHDGPI